MDKAIQKLLHGFKNFRNNYFVRNRELFSHLRTGQHPKILVISCSDSRVDPALLTDCDPGDLFVVRNIANLVPPYEPGTTLHHGVSAALEYAVKKLRVQHIVVMGHSDCGGINALVSECSIGEHNEFIDSWLEIAAPAKLAVEEKMPEAPHRQKCQACEEAAILLSLENLLSFPWVAEAVENGRLAVHAWYFNLDQGVLYEFDSEVNEFQKLS